MSDAEFLKKFEAQAIPSKEWTHRAHVKVAYLYLSQNSFDDALMKMREGIKALNAANGVKEGPLSGYNETTTHAFLHLVAAVRGAYAKMFPASNADEFCDLHPQLMTQQVLRLFYSPERRMDPMAKTEFVEPDLAPLPKILPG